MIAGFIGGTHYEFLDRGLKLAETALENRHQRRKFIVVLYDGDPVYEGVEGNDLTLSHTHIRHLGDDADLVAKLKLLF